MTHLDDHREEGKAMSRAARWIDLAAILIVLAVMTARPAGAGYVNAFEIGRASCRERV